MKKNLYSHFENTKYAHTKKAYTNNPSRKNRQFSQKHVLKNPDQVLNDRLDALMKKYEDTPEIRARITGELQILRVNLAIARDMGSVTQEKALRKSFDKFLKQFEKK